MIVHKCLTNITPHTNPLSFTKTTISIRIIKFTNHPFTPRKDVLNPREYLNICRVRLTYKRANMLFAARLAKKAHRLSSSAFNKVSKRTSHP